MYSFKVLFYFASGLKDENKKLHCQIKEQELAAESEKQLTLRLKQSLERVVAENAELSSTLSETRHKLDSEIRVRENRDAKLLLDTQACWHSSQRLFSFSSVFTVV